MYFLQGVYPTTAELFFKLLLNDDSNFTNEYRAARKDAHLSVSYGLCHASCINIFYFYYLIVVVKYDAA